MHICATTHMWKSEDHFGKLLPPLPQWAPWIKFRLPGLLSKCSCTEPLRRRLEFHTVQIWQNWCPQPGTKAAAPPEIPDPIGPRYK